MTKYFLRWFDKHITNCAECKRDGLASKCPSMVENRAVTDKFIEQHPV